jgi:hypothetical protein
MADGLTWDDEAPPAGVEWDAPQESLLDRLKRQGNALRIGVESGATAQGRPAVAGFAAAEGGSVGRAVDAVRDAVANGDASGLVNRPLVNALKQAAGGDFRGALKTAVRPGSPLGLTLGEYREGRDAARAEETQAAHDAPYAYYPGAVLGGMLIPGGQASKAATWGARARAAIAPGAALGGLGGINASEADLTQGDTEGAGQGAGVGLAAGALLAPLGSMAGDAAGAVGGAVARRAGDYLDDFAAMRALKAAGYIAKDIKPMARRGLDSVATRGQALLDEPGLITAGASTETVAERLKDAAAKYGGRIGDILKLADDNGARFDFEPFLARVKAEILDPIAGDPAVRSEAAEIQKFIDGYRKLAADKPGGVTLQEANTLKSRLQKTINFGNFFATGGPAENGERFLRQMDGLFIDEVDGQLGKIAGPKVLSEFKAAKAGYGAMIDALDKAKQGVARDVGNGFIGMKDYLGGIAGAAASMGTGSYLPLLMAGGATAANKLISSRGASTAARLASGVGHGFDGVAQLLPRALGRYTGPVSSAIERVLLPPAPASQPALPPTRTQRTDASEDVMRARALAAALRRGG